MVSEVGSSHVLDLYILKKKTDFYNQIMVAWNDSKVRLTLDDSDLVSPDKTSSRSAEHFFRQFTTLQSELLGASDQDSCTLLCHELSTAAQKYFIVKMLFWEDTDLLKFILKLLEDRLSRCTLEARQLEKNLEHVVVLMNILYQMLRETHSLNPRRLVPLFQDEGAVIQSLCVMTTQQFSLLTDELDKLLVAEIVEMTCGLLHEVFQAVEQARWLLCGGRFRVSTAWLVTRIVQEGKLDKFHAKLVNYASEVLAINPKDPGPLEMVTLYQLGSVLLTILKNSPSQVLYYKEHFSEEFKYYISRRYIEAKLSPTSPLTKNIMDSLHTCSSRVLS